MDKEEIIRTSIERRPLLIYGDGTLGGEIIENKPWVDGGTRMQKLIIKFSPDLKKWYKEKLRQEDLADGYTETDELDKFLIPLRRGGDMPIILALRSFDKQNTPLTLLHQPFIDLIKSQQLIIREKDIEIHTVRKELEKFTQGDFGIRIKQLFKEASNELVLQWASMREALKQR